MRGWVLLGLLTLPVPAGAQAPVRERSLVVYGEDPCPQPADPEEIVVCARLPESERYRIPPRLRRGPDRIETSWGSRAETLEEAQRDTRPDGCSVVGTWGQTGCRQELLRRWAAERRMRRREP